MTRILPHEQLNCYRRALAFAEMAVGLIDSWPPRAAVRGQMARAMESIFTNIACAARQQRTDQGIYLLECSLGSVLECAACLDVARLRQLMDAPEVRAAKLVLQEVARMEVGLRKSWSGGVQEDGGSYAASDQHYFNHESLSVYQCSLELHEELGPILCDNKSENRYLKRIDDLSTSLTLNIAEGNGRFSCRDHGEFISVAEDSGTRLAAYMDLATAAGVADMDGAKSLLRDIMTMLSGLEGYFDSKS